MRKSIWNINIKIMSQWKKKKHFAHFIFAVLSITHLTFGVSYMYSLLQITTQHFFGLRIELWLWPFRNPPFLLNHSFVNLLFIFWAIILLKGTLLVRLQPFYCVVGLTFSSSTLWFNVKFIQYSWHYDGKFAGALEQQNTLKPQHSHHHSSLNFSLKFSPSITTFDSSVQGKLFQRSGSSCRCWTAFLFWEWMLLLCWPYRFVHSLSNIWLEYIIHIDCFQSCLKIPWWHPGVLWDFLKHLALCYWGEFGGTIKWYCKYVEHPHNVWEDGMGWEEI